MLMKKRIMILSLITGIIIFSHCNSEEPKTKEQENAEKRVERDKEKIDSMEKALKEKYGVDSF